MFSSRSTFFEFSPTPSSSRTRFDSGTAPLPTKEPLPTKALPLRGSQPQDLSPPESDVPPNRGTLSSLSGCLSDREEPTPLRSPADPWLDEALSQDVLPEAFLAQLHAWVNNLPDDSSSDCLPA